MKLYRIHGGLQFCSNHCATSHRIKHGFVPGYLRDKILNQYRTDIEAMVEQALIALGIPYLFEHKIGRYSADFALPDLGIVLEADGWHHETERVRKRDEIRDRDLAAAGWQVIHLPDPAIRKNALALVTDALALHNAIHPAGAVIQLRIEV